MHNPRLYGNDGLKIDDLNDRLAIARKEIARLTAALAEREEENKRLVGLLSWRLMDTIPEYAMVIVKNERGEVCPMKVRGDHQVIENMAGSKNDWTFGTNAIAWMPFPDAISPPEAKGREEKARWPSGCHSASSCSRHRRCMYTGCAHSDQEVEDGLAAHEAKGREGQDR